MYGWYIWYKTLQVTMTSQWPRKMLIFKLGAISLILCNSKPMTRSKEALYEIKSNTGFAITICSSPLLKYWSPWLFSRQHCGHQWCSISVSNYTRPLLLHTKGHTSNPWKKRPLIGFTTTGEQIPIEIHYRSLTFDHTQKTKTAFDGARGAIQIFSSLCYHSQLSCVLVKEKPLLLLNQKGSHSFARVSLEYHVISRHNFQTFAYFELANLP